MRLSLALLAAALLPFAVVAPVLRTITDDTRAAETTRLQTEATQLSAAVSVELERVRLSLVPTTGKLTRLIAAQPKTLAKDVRDSLARLIVEDGGLVGIEALDADGATIGHAETAAAGERPAPPALVRAVRASAGSDLVIDTGPSVGDQVVAAMPLRADGTYLGALIVRFSLAAVIEDAGIVAAGDRSIAIFDATHAGPRFTTLGADDGPAPGRAAAPSARAGAGIASDLPAGKSDHATVRAPFFARGFEAWSIELRAPVSFGALSVESLAALTIACLALAVLLVWMARRVLQPAEELERSRAAIGVLYDAEREASLRDGLTGIGNHRAFQEDLARQVDQSARYHVPLSVLLIDLDEFKQVNDNLGHAVGDDLLAEVGRILRATVRQADRAFRIGGDEFAVVLPHTDSAGAQDLAQRIMRQTLADRSAGAYRRPISFSAGIASTPEHATDRVQLMTRADAALYRSKRAGRTTITVYDAGIDQPVISDAAKAELSAKVAALIQGRLMRPAYQPIVHVASGRIIAYEGLVRPTKESGFDSPVALFSAAELTGRTVELDRACLDVVVAGAVSLPEEVFVSLNISPRSFEAPEFSANAFLQILRKHHVAPGRVILELTERDVIQDLDRLRTALDACRAAGVQIAADDVGAGNAGIRLLSQIEFNVMKIDLSLVQASAGREPVTSVLKSLVELALRWRALVVAEGVETPEHLRLIQGLGIEAAQGYLLGRPGPLRTEGHSMDVAALMPAPTWWDKATAARVPLN